uniref:Transposase n=1 Tax=Steinernema glaseri TaxID=37863 RepID=A0A1I8ACG5_9BILA
MLALAFNGSTMMRLRTSGDESCSASDVRALRRAVYRIKTWQHRFITRFAQGGRENGVWLKGLVIASYCANGMPLPAMPHPFRPSYLFGGKPYLYIIFLQ